MGFQAPQTYPAGNGKVSSASCDVSHTLTFYRLFIVEGAITVALAIVVFFCLPDCRFTPSVPLPRTMRSLTPNLVPGTAKWLTVTEKAFLQARLPENSPRSKEKNFVWKEVVTTLKDQRLWLFTLSWALMTSGASGVKFYQPTIIANMGFRSV